MSIDHGTKINYNNRHPKTACEKFELIIQWLIRPIFQIQTKFRGINVSFTVICFCVTQSFKPYVYM